MEWISVTKKPIKDIMAMVSNSKGWMYNIPARYDSYSDTWILQDDNYRHSLTLEITHYIEIPPWVREK